MKNGCIMSKSKHEVYWVDQFEGELPVLELAIDKVRPAIKTNNTEIVNKIIAKELPDKLKSITNERESSLFMGLLGLVNILLYRYTDQKELIIGNPIFNTKDKKSSVQNILALRTRFSGDDSYENLLDNIKQITLEAYEHQEYPFNELKEKLKIKSDMSRNALFDVMISLQKNAKKLNKEDQKALPSVDLSFVFTEIGKELHLSIEYSSDLYHSETIEQLANHLEQLLEKITQTPEKPINEIDYLSKEEKQKLLLEFNDTESNFPHDETLLNLFEAQVEKTPDKVAMVFKEMEFSYKKLNEISNQLADYLRSHYNIKPDDLICINLDRSERMIVTILGILKSGGAYVPIDPSYPEDRINYIKNDSGCKVLIDEKEFAKFKEEQGKYSKKNYPSITSPMNLAYVIYTSGSTGQPKGCMLEHRGVINRIEWMWNKYGFTEQDIILQKTTNTFDVSVWELFMPLCWGVKMVLCQKEDISSPERIIRLIKSQQVTCLHFVPSMLNAFIRIGFSNPELSSDLSSLKRVITSGEALSLETVRNWYDKLDIVIQNLYGPTEASVDVTYFETSKKDEIIPIGKPIDNTQIYIVDSNQKLTPVGVMGEVCIGGVGLARGYLNKPELTAEKFVQNPFRAGERMYKTGDLGRFLSDGNVEYLGRKDDQVKVRGFRIELGEIESVLEKHELIEEVVVLAKDDAKGEKDLVMYYVPDLEKGYTIRKILQNAKKGLPDRVELQELPNGMSLYTYNKSELKFLYEEIFEDKIYFKHGISIPENGCVVDIGANLGMFTICSNFIAKNVKVYSFEPLPPTFELLKLNSSLYKNHIKLFNCGISNKKETVSFKYYPNATILSSRYSEEKDVSETVKQYILNSEDFAQNEYTEENIQELLKERLVTEEFDCELKTLSQIISDENIEKVDLLKIDVEKSELDVLEGISEKDWKKIKQLVLEVHDSDNRLKFVTDLLEKHNFKVYIEQDSVVNETKLYDLFAISSDLLNESQNIQINCDIENGSRLGLNGLRESMKNFSKEKLPEYMIPSFFVELEELPLTPNGKVDRKKLLTLENNSVIYQDYIAPKSEIEKLLVGIWEKLLGREKIGVKDDFFELGGHSLKAAQVVNQVNAAGYNLELRDFMVNKTIQNISLIVGEKTKETNYQEIEKIERNKEYYSITKTQRELWFLDKLDNSQRSHNILFRCDFEEGVDIALLTKSLNMIFKHYECFHSVFKEENEVPTQKILKINDISIPVIKDDINKVIDEFRQVKIDIATGPLFFSKYVEQDNKYTLLINIHHIIFDGCSLAIFMEKIQEVYSALRNSQEFLFKDEIQNIDLAEWQNNRVVSYEKQLSFWKNNLIPFAPKLDLPIKTKRAKNLSSNGERYWFDIDKELRDKLADFAKDNSVTLFAVLLSAYKCLLAKHSKQSDIVIGTPYANRKTVQEESLIGYYSNMIAIRTNLAKHTTFKDLIHSVNNNAMNAFSNSDISFGDLVKELNYPNNPSITPIYQAMFIMQNWHADEAKGSLRISQKELGVNSAKTDIALNSEEINNGIEFWFEYNTDLFAESFIIDLKNDFIDLLNSIDSTKDIEYFENKKSCFILTETSLGIRCAEELLKHNYHIYGIISPDEQVQKWAENHDIYVANLNKKELTKLLQKNPYEYLFSIVNGIILDDEILETPQKLAINYHDSLLPEYAGMYASFWALLNNEKTHGITWHIIDSGIDTGNILKQKKLDIEKNETSISLNAKCYEIAYSAFSELLGDIENNALNPLKQSTSQRTYNSFYKRPENMGVLTPKNSLEENKRIVNALNFGGQDNPIATPKVLIDDKYYVVSEINEKNIKTDFLITGESTGNLSIFENSRISIPDKDDLLELAESAKNENYWIQQILLFDPLELPQNDFKPIEKNKNLRISQKNLPEYLLFLAKISSQEHFSVILELDKMHSLNKNPLISSNIPFHINIDFNQTFIENIKSLKNLLNIASSKGSFATDIFFRYSSLDKIKNIFYQFKVPQFDELFSAFIANAEEGAKLKDIPMIPVDELVQIEKWNDTTTTFVNQCDEYPLDQTYQYLFEKRFEQYKDSKAVTFNGTSLTYQELNVKANQFAEYLRSVGVGKNTPVGICMDRSLYAIISILGIIKAGGAYMPIDPDYPIERKKFMLDDSEAKVLIADKHLLDSLPATKVKIICPATEWDNLTNKFSGKNNLININTPEDSFYIIYTSGSTGKPKGVQITHRNILNHNFSVIRDFALTKKDIVMQFGSISFDLSAEEIFPTLLLGAQLLLRTDDVLSSMNKFIAFVNDNKVSVLDLPTAFWHELVDNLKDNSMPPSVKLVIIGGEKASSEKMKRWLKYTKSKVRLLNTYGPTETTIIASMFECDKNMISGEVPIGRPIANTQFYVLDSYLQHVPIGISGELYIGGAGVAKGYINRKELTTEKFIQNHFSQNSNAKLYKTGDLVRYRTDGCIDFVGRIDHQVKIRGFRIELGEVESVMLALDSVKDVTVVLREEQSDKCLTAYYVLNPSAQKSSEEIKNEMSKRLPDYMIPALFMELNKIPVTPNGKVDKKNLPEPKADNLFLNDEYIQPSTKIEIQIAKIFQEVLHLNKVSIEDSFFKLGGHSLNALQVVARIEDHFNLKCQVSSIFEYPSIIKLAEYIENIKKTASLEDYKIRKNITTEVLPLSFSQKRLWFLDKYDSSENQTYNVPVTFGLIGKLDIEILKKSFNILIERHHSLRTVFHEENGVPSAQLCNVFDIEISVKNANEENIEKLLLKQSQYHFHVDKLPLFKVSLLKLSKKNQVMMINLHHIICDAWSIKNMVEELNIIYSALSKKTGSFSEKLLPELPIQYSDFTVWQSEQKDKEYFKQQFKYWRNQLKGCVDIELPLDFPRPDNQKYNGDIVRFNIPKEIIGKIKSLTGKTETSIFMIFLTVFNILLKRYTGAEDIVVGTPVANRKNKDLEHIIGIFINSLALRNNLSGEISFLDLLSRVKASSIAAFDNQDVPIEILIDSLKIKRNSSKSPIFQTMIILQNASNDIHFKLPELEEYDYKFNPKISKFDLTLILEENNEAIDAGFEFNTELYKKETIERMSKHYIQLLTAAINKPETNINKLNILTPAEFKLQIETWNKTESPIPNIGVYKLIEEKCAHYAEKIAIICGKHKCSYKELGDKSNQLANYLIEHNVQKGDYVAIYMNRSIDMLVSLIAVWKAGAAYIPLDPSFPHDRLNYMIQDSNPKVIITEKELEDSTILNNINTITLDKEWDDVIKMKTLLPGISFSPDAPAYVIYTSGSTGKPKGVIVSQKCMLNFLLSMQKSPGMTENDRILAITTLSFDIAVLELYLPLITGAQIILVTSEDVLDSFKLIELIEECNVTVLQATPSSWKMLLDANWKGNSNLKALTGGEPINPPLAKKLLERCSELWNMYGPTETTVWSTIFKIENSPPPILIGTPIDNTQVYILDSNNNITPVGVPGKLFIGGDGVSLGYLHRPELTAEKFIDSPFVDGKLIYDTGDIARFDVNGQLECLGRNDLQVKVSGHRIELDEISSELIKIAGIHDAVVNVFEDNNQIKRLAGYLIFEEEKVISQEKIKETLKINLPNYMVPNFYITMDAFPLTPNGKTDRKQLPKPDIVGIESNSDFVVSYTPVQEILCNTYQNLLNIKKVGIKDNFFELGGDSLLTIQVIDTLNKAGLKITVEQMFKYHSIEELAAIVEDKKFPIGNNNEPACLIELQKGKKGNIPFFLMHTPPGDLLGYVNLVKELNNDIPIFGFKSIGLENKDLSHTSIEEMVEYYIEKLLIVQPEGPYMLGGWCLGGTIAFEVAQQLTEQGHEVALLTVFDSVGLTPKKLSLNLIYNLNRLIGFLCSGPTKCLNYFAAKRIINNDEKNLIADHDNKFKDIGIFANRSFVRQKNMSAINKYETEYYDGEVIVFIAEEQHPGIMPHKQLNWTTLAKKITTYSTPGDHAGLLKLPHVKTLAENLNRLIKDAVTKK